MVCQFQRPTIIEIKTWKKTAAAKDMLLQYVSGRPEKGWRCAVTISWPPMGIKRISCSVACFVFPFIWPSLRNCLYFLPAFDSPWCHLWCFVIGHPYTDKSLICSVLTHLSQSSFTVNLYADKLHYRGTANHRLVINGLEVLWWFDATTNS